MYSLFKSAHQVLDRRMSKKRQLSNGTAATDANTTNDLKELTEQKVSPKNVKSKEELLRYVESRKDYEPPFRLEYVRQQSNSKKRKRSTTDDQTARKVQLDGFEHESSFNTRLNCRYKISPKDNWSSMRPYKKFTLTHQNGEGTTTISVGDCVLVVNDPTLADTATADESELWKAKVLQVRAIDAEHAYVLVAWLSRPEDMENGRQPWQGYDELIPTNQLDVIEALSVNGRINVRYLPDSEENDDEGEFDSLNVDSAVRYYWRQTYDFANGKKYSPLEKICVDNQPRNPDEVSVKCRNTECGKWMHANCFASKAIKKARECRIYNENSS